MRHLRQILILLLVVVTNASHAQNWDTVQDSGDYYYGEGIADNPADAEKQALEALVNMIAVNVSSDFTLIDDITTTSGAVEHQSRVLGCVRTYSHSSLRDVGKFDEERGGKYIARRFIKRSEMQKIYEGRKSTALTCIANADRALARGNVDMALQYYYWAYSLIRTLQSPEELTNIDGETWHAVLNAKIATILKDIDVNYDGRDDERVRLLFTYQGHPVSSIIYNFNNGRDMEYGHRAKDGRGILVMAPGLERTDFHVDIEYQFVEAALGDTELHSVLEAIVPITFGDAHKVVSAPRGESTLASEILRISEEAGVHLAAKEIAENVGADPYEECRKVVNEAIEALSTRSSLKMGALCTDEGLERYERLINYGQGRVIGTPDLHFSKGLGNYTVVRGLQMSFVVGRGASRRTFVEDVVIDVDSTNRICNMAFGLGSVATNAIMNQEASGWKDYTREMLIEFLEGYRTAFCLEDLEHIRSIFADEATILVGHFVRSGGRSSSDIGLTEAGRERVEYKEYDKESYMRHLQNVFALNDYINIKFGNNQVKWLEKFPDKELFAINIRQEYSSPSYSDKGHLFLLIDMTDHSKPEIYKRAWQPNEVPLDKLLHEGDFYGIK